jgi:LPXTG-site transpeptidase (sortase) family protein
LLTSTNRCSGFRTNIETGTETGGSSTAHVTSASGRAGPFRNLKNLRWDDKVIIHYAGQQYLYSVRRTASVRPNDASIFRHEERAWLTLVTCREYDAAKDAYRMRTLVRAVLTSIEPDS